MVTGRNSSRERITTTRCLTASSMRVWHISLLHSQRVERSATLDAVESPACRTYCVRRVTCIGSCWYTLETRKSRRVGVLLRCRPAAAAVERPARRGAGANNYLGLSNHPRLREAAHRALDEHGFGLSSVRFICGTQDAHRRLEAQLADFHHQQAAILYPSCFDANAGLFEARPCLGRPAWVALPVRGGLWPGAVATDSTEALSVACASQGAKPAVVRPGVAFDAVHVVQA